MDAFFVFGAVYAFSFSIAGLAALFSRSSKKDKKRMLAFALILVPSAYAMAAIARYVYPNPRPFISDGVIALISQSERDGFPSGHTLFCSLCAALAYPFSRRLSLWLWLVAFYVGLSRVYVGVHHFIDIAASLVIVVLLGSLIWKSGLVSGLVRQFDSK